VIGFVAIGRNEGARLERCLASLRKASDRIVYVDSGSTDGSAQTAAKGVLVVLLDQDQPFTAARARNAGYRRLAEVWPDADPVMFIDGDCELAPRFLETAEAALGADPSIGVLVGRVRERHPEASLYNRLCEMEWRGPLGDIRACGGIFLIRRRAFDAADGFNPAIIAAEDDELCVRLRAAGWRIRRIDADMCSHDAAMRKFSQWWRRAVRAGHAYAQVGAIHRGYFLSERLRALAWALALPAGAIAGAPMTGGLTLAAFALYPLSFLRTRGKLMRDGATPEDAGLYAAFLTLAKFPNLVGMLSYWLKRASGRRIDIVEYK
jgi:GT2 family glycosyltransferase